MRSGVCRSYPHGFEGYVRGVTWWDRALDAKQVPTRSFPEPSRKLSSLSLKGDPEDKQLSHRIAATSQQVMEVTKSKDWI